MHVYGFISLYSSEIVPGSCILEFLSIIIHRQEKAYEFSKRGFKNKNGHKNINLIWGMSDLNCLLS